MVRYIVIIALLLSACAQVGTITGGATDETAPKVLAESIANKQRNVSANEQLLVFDEYIKLDQPQQRISLMPADSRLKYELKGKTLRISFLDPLQPQTTYTLMSNGGVKDLTEGNDSLMTWTFSTGPILDSLQITAQANEIVPNSKSKSIFLGLYTSDSSKTARYIGCFDQQGKLKLNGLKDGAYYLKAYIDENQDGACAITESQDVFFKPILLSQIQADTLHFFLSTPQKSKENLQAVNPVKPVTKENVNDSLKVAKPLSKLLISLDTLVQPLLVELYLGEALQKQVIAATKTIYIDSLEAGVYTLRLIADRNNNQKWDAINLIEQQRAELIYTYPEKIKIRPNWELSLPVNIPKGSLFIN
jgi:hypothetical protein